MKSVWSAIVKWFSQLFSGHSSSPVVPGQEPVIPVSPQPVPVIPDLPPSTPPTPAPTPNIEPVVPAPVKTNGLDGILRSCLVAMVRKDLGQRETKGFNRSPRIDAINARAGEDMGQPYCASGATGAWADVCISAGLKNPLGIESGSQDVIEKVPNKYKRSGLAKAGDLTSFTNRTDDSKGHIGTLIKDQDKATPDIFESIEYNTGVSEGSPDDGVYLRIRTKHGGNTLVFRYFLDIVTWTMDYNQIPMDRR